MEKLNNTKFQKLEQFKINNLDLVRGGMWSARTRKLDESEWSDAIMMSYTGSNNQCVEFATSKRDQVANCQ
jgi:hypothetical protein